MIGNGRSAVVVVADVKGGLTFCIGNKGCCCTSPADATGGKETAGCGEAAGGRGTGNQGCGRGGIGQDEACAANAAVLYLYPKKEMQVRSHSCTFVFGMQYSDQLPYTMFHNS